MWASRATQTQLCFDYSRHCRSVFAVNSYRISEAGSCVNTAAGWIMFELLFAGCRVSIAGLSPGRSYTFIVHAENGVSDQSNDNRRATSVTVSTLTAGEP